MLHLIPWAQAGLENIGDPPSAPETLGIAGLVAVLVVQAFLHETRPGVSNRKVGSRKHSGVSRQDLYAEDVRALGGGSMSPSPYPSGVSISFGLAVVDNVFGGMERYRDAANILPRTVPPPRVDRRLWQFRLRRSVSCCRAVATVAMALFVSARRGSSL